MALLLLLTGGLGSAPAYGEEEPAHNPRSVVIEVRGEADTPLPGRAVEVFHVRPHHDVFQLTLADRDGDPHTGFEPPAPAFQGALIAKTRHTTNARGLVTVDVDLGLIAVAEVEAGQGYTGGAVRIGRGLSRVSRARIDVQPGRLVTGRLVLPGGTPAAGFVTARPLATRVAWPTVQFPPSQLVVARRATDAAGRFQTIVPADSACLVDAFVPGSFERRGVVAFPDTNERFDVLLGDSTGTLVTGKVTDTTGGPIAGALVAISAWSRGTRTGRRTQRVMARTDVEGTYRLRGITPGTIGMLTAAAEGFADVQLHNLQLNASAGQEYTLDVSLQRGATLAGRVLDEEGRPVGGARVMVEPDVADGWELPWRQRFARTGADGRYVLHGLWAGLCRVDVEGPGEWQRLPAMILAGGRASGVRSVTPAAVREPLHIPREGPPVRRDFVLPTAVPVHGFVQTPDGTPLPYVPISATFVRKLDRRDVRSLPRGWTALSDAAGRFTVQSVPHGVRIRIGTQETRRGSTTPFVETHRDQVLEPVRIVVPRGTTVRGTVRDADGNPLAGVHVQGGGTPRRVVTDALGRYELTGVTPGTWVVQVQAGVRSERPRRLIVPDQSPIAGFDLVWRGSGTIRGRVVDANKRPLSGVAVGTSRFAFPGAGSFGAVSDQRGEFTLTHVPAGKQWISAGARSAETSAGPNHVVLRTVDSTWDFVRGEVFAPDGTRVPLGRVQVLRGKIWRGVVEIKAGHFAIPRRMLSGSGAVELAVTDALDFALQQIDAEPTAVELDAEPLDKPLRLTLRPGKRVTGTLRDRDGRPAAGVDLCLSMEDNAWWAHRHVFRTRSDEEGRFRFLGIPRDTHAARVSVVADSSYVLLPHFDVVPAENLAEDPVELTVVRAKTIEGVVVDVDGEPVPRARITVWAPPADVPPGVLARDQQVLADHEGRFEVGGLHPDVTWMLRGRQPEDRTGYLATLMEGLRAGAGPVRVTLDPALSIQGRLALPKGRTLARFEVKAEPALPDPTLSHRSAYRVDGGTTFALSELRRGRYRITVKPTVDFKVPDPIVVEAPATDLVIELERAYPLRGRMLGGEHRRGTLTFHPDGVDLPKTQLPRASTEEDGSFVVPNEHDATGTLLVQLGPELAAVRADVHPDAGPFELTLEPTVPVRGVIEGMPEKLWLDRRVVTLHLGSLVYRAPLARDGTFSAKRLPAGTYRIEVPLEGIAGRIEGVLPYTTGTGTVRLRYVVP